MDLELNSHRSLTELNQDQERDKKTQFTTSIGQTFPQENPTPPTSKYIALLRWINDHWALEIASCIGGLVALFCIVGVLLKYDGSAIPEWPYGITINSVLSWIVLVFNAFMLGTIATCFGQMAWVNFNSPTDKPLSDVSSYHWASRGAIGCVAFIWASRMRNWASLGAFATIVAVGVSPFVQQMATVENNRVQVNWPASVGRAQTYFNVEGYITDGIGYLAPEGIRAAIYSFLLASPGSSGGGDSSTAPRPSIPVRCDSGDCDFSPFQSLAICSDCSDISNVLTSHCGVSPCTPEITMCNYSLPNGMHTNVSSYVTTSETYFETMASYTGNITTSEKYFESIASYTGNETLVGRWPDDRSMILNLTEIRAQSLANISEPKATAARCSLRWCVNTYSARVRNHTLFENVTHSWYDPNPVRTVVEKPQLVRLDFKPPSKGNLTQSNFTIDNGETFLTQAWLVDNIVVRYSFDTSCESDGTASLNSNGRTRTELQGPLRRSSLEDTFQRLATAMTIAVRSVDPVAQTTAPVGFGPVEGVGLANGTSFATATQIKVQWAWIIVPSLLLILTTLFLGITIVKTRQNGLKAWKQSPLALVCAGVNESTQQQIRAAGDPTMMEEMADHIQVHLQKEAEITNGRWRLEATRGVQS